MFAFHSLAQSNFAPNAPKPFPLRPELPPSKRTPLALSVQSSDIAFFSYKVQNGNRGTSSGGCRHAVDRVTTSPQLAPQYQGTHGQGSANSGSTKVEWGIGRCLVWVDVEGERDY